MKKKIVGTKERFYILPIFMTPALFLIPRVFEDSSSDLQVYVTLLVLTTLFAVAFWVASRFKAKARMHTQRVE